MPIKCVLCPLLLALVEGLGSELLLFSSPTISPGKWFYRDTQSFQVVLLAIFVPKF